MQQLQRDCDNRTGVWAKIRNPRPDILEQRRKDIIAIKKHMYVKEKNRQPKPTSRFNNYFDDFFFSVKT